MRLEDKELEPFYLETDENNIVLIEKATIPNKQTGAIKEILRHVGYFSSVENALKRAVTMKIMRQQETLNLEEYIKVLRDLNNRISNLFNSKP